MRARVKQKFWSRARVISDFWLKTDLKKNKTWFVAISLITRARALFFSEWVRHKVFYLKTILAHRGPSRTRDIAIYSKKHLKMGFHSQNLARAGACTRVTRNKKSFLGPSSISLSSSQILFRGHLYFWRYRKGQKGTKKRPPSIFASHVKILKL